MSLPRGHDVVAIDSKSTRVTEHDPVLASHIYADDWQPFHATTMVAAGDLMHYDNQRQRYEGLGS